jgi:hypothetical protein
MRKLFSSFTRLVTFENLVLRFVLGWWTDLCRTASNNWRSKKWKKSTSTNKISLKNKDTVHIILKIFRYNNAYSAPVLWFNFYEQNGKLLYLEDFETFLSTDSAGTEILKGLSQNEHPIHGIAFYNIHPCKTADFMQNFITQNYIVR